MRVFLVLIILYDVHLAGPWCIGYCVSEEGSAVKVDVIAFQLHVCVLFLCSPRAAHWWKRRPHPLILTQTETRRQLTLVKVQVKRYSNCSVRHIGQKHIHVYIVFA